MEITSLHLSDTRYEFAENGPPLAQGWLQRVQGALERTSASLGSHLYVEEGGLDLNDDTIEECAKTIFAIALRYDGDNPDEWIEVFQEDVAQTSTRGRAQTLLISKLQKNGVSMTKQERKVLSSTVEWLSMIIDDTGPVAKEVKREV